MYKMILFKNVLKNLDIDPEIYLKYVNKQAKEYNYNKMFFSNDPKYKIMTQDDNKKWIKFGSSTNNDYIIYSILESYGVYPDGTAEKKRQQYLARATKIKGEWKDNKYSKNNLAIRILWN
jgi:hypothetical protein